jgi:Phage integrase family
LNDNELARLQQHRPQLLRRYRRARMIERAAAGAGLELKAHPYMLRHGCGYALANKGPDTRAILGWLGHLSITKTAVYTALAPNRFKDFWVSQLGRSFSDLRLGHRGRESFARLPSPRPGRWQLAEMIYDGGLRPGWQDWGWGAHEISATSS